MRATPTIAFASVLLGTVAALAAPANAACKKFGFTVNDYGKDGPTNDAKNLLDKHITEWAAKNGVTDYSTGKKTVSCELFLDVILFDEHTCTASATVCWGADAKKLGSQSAAAPAEESPSGAPPAPVRKAEALGTATQQAAAPAAASEADVSSDAPATDTAAVEAAPTTPVEHIAAPAETPAAAPAVHTAPPAAQPAPSQAAAPAAPATTGAVVETGALQAGQNFAPQDQRRATAVAPEPDRAAAAAAAASAAAAAERAAQAAETAANAAKEAAAAAVAASAASKRGATVPPLNHASGSQPPHAE